MRRVGPLLTAIALAGCGKEAGVEGTEILANYDSLRGGVIFASSVIIDSNDYDLYWAPVPVAPTTDVQPLTRLTEAHGNEYQPSVSLGGKGIAFVREKEGIFLINTSGRISRVSDTSRTDFIDSLPAVSYDGRQVAWVREDHSRPIGQSGFDETYIMVADFDGNNARAAEPRAGLVQDAPAWEPLEASSRLAWTEFNATTLGGGGPVDYGVYMYNLATGTGRYICQDPPKDIPNDYGPRGDGYRCFGEHLAWPVPNTVVTGQDLIEIDVNTGALNTVWPQVVIGLQTQMLGSPYIGAVQQPGFFPAFPLSVSYNQNNQMIVDGAVSMPVEGEEDTLAFFIADWEGGGIWRLYIDGFRNDLDSGGTHGFLFSLATPQFVP